MRISRQIMVAGVLIAVLGVALVAAVAYAQSSSTISACALTNRDGDLRLVDGPDDCRPNEEFVSWPADGGGGGGDFGDVLSVTTFKFAASDCPTDQFRLVVASQVGLVLPWIQSDCTSLVQVPDSPIIFANALLDVGSVPQLEGAFLEWGEVNGGWTFLTDGVWRISCGLLAATAPGDELGGADLGMNCAIGVGTDEQARLLEVLVSEEVESPPLVFKTLP